MRFLAGQTRKAPPRTMKKAKLYPILIVILCLPTVASARAYKLDEILDLARKGNPGLAAGEQATAGIEAQLLEARRNYYPTGELNSLLSQAPRISCTGVQGAIGSDGKPLNNEQNCVETQSIGTNSSGFLAAITPAGVFTRTELKLVQPIYTFGKISAGVAAAESGVKASQSRQFGLVADLELNVRKAYWGAKLATEILATLNEASGYLDTAQKKIEEELAEGTGDASVTDRLRLRTMRAEIDGRILEAQRMADLARSGLRALIGPDAPADFDVDPDPLEALKFPIVRFSATKTKPANPGPRSRPWTTWWRPSAPWPNWNRGGSTRTSCSSAPPPTPMRAASTRPRMPISTIPSIRSVRASPPDSTCRSTWA
jgi:outer membrane protein TolC